MEEMQEYCEPKVTYIGGDSMMVPSAAFAAASVSQASASHTAAAHVSAVAQAVGRVAGAVASMMW